MKSCGACNQTLPDEARFCGHCGAPQALASGSIDDRQTMVMAGQPPTPDVPVQPSPGPDLVSAPMVGVAPNPDAARKVPWKPLFLLVVLGGGVLGGLVYLSNLSDATGAALSDVTMVVDENFDGSVDVYVAEDPDSAAQAVIPQNRILEDVRLGGDYAVVSDSAVSRYSDFDLAYEGGALVSYRSEGSEDWTLGVLKDRRISEIGRFSGNPSVWFLDAGTFIVAGSGSESCTVARLDGFEVSPITNAEFCTMNPLAELVLLRGPGSSIVEVSLLNLANESIAPVMNVNRNASVSAFLSPSGQSILVSSFDTEPRSVLIDRDSGARIASADLSGMAPTDSMFVGRDLAGGGFFVVSPDGSREIPTASDRQLAQTSPSGRWIAVLELLDASGVTVSSLAVGDEQVSELRELASFPAAASFGFLDEGQLLVATQDGRVLIGDEDELVEIGSVSAGSGSAGPAVYASAGIPLIEFRGDERTVLAIVKPDGDGEVIELDNIGGIYTLHESFDGRRIALVTVPNSGERLRTLTVVDVRSGQARFVGRFEEISDIQFDQDKLYFSARPMGQDLQALRATLGDQVQTEVLGRGFRVMVPDVNSSRRW